MEIVIPIVTGLVRYYSNKQRNILYDTGSLKSQIARWENSSHFRVITRQIMEHRITLALPLPPDFS